MTVSDHELGTEDVRVGFTIDEDLLGEVAARRPFSEGRLVCVQGQPADGIYVITEGQVLLCRSNDEGEDYALYLLGPGELFGEGALHPDGEWLVSVRGITDGMAYFLPVTALSRIFQHYPRLGVQVMGLLGRRLERSHRRLDLVQSHNSRHQLLRLLHVMADYHGKSSGEAVWLPATVTQAELGEMVGLARETVVRALAELEAEGAIRREGRKGYWLRGEDRCSV